MVGRSTETTTMIRPEDIGSLTDFSRNAKAHLKRLKRTGRPEPLTVNGKAEVVVQGASAYHYQRPIGIARQKNIDLPPSRSKHVMVPAAILADRAPLSFA
jgi:hypothetical protein